MFCARHVGLILTQVHVKCRFKSHQRRESLKALGLGLKVIQY
jgi:hypothetical protein